MNQSAPAEALTSKYWTGLSLMTMPAVIVVTGMIIFSQGGGAGLDITFPFIVILLCYPLVVMAELFVLVMWAWSWFTLGRNPRAMLLVLAIAHVVAVGMAYKGIGIIIIT